MDPREKSRHQQAVEQLMEKAGQELPGSPVIPDEQVRILRARLILEEALEFCEAAGLYLSIDTGDHYIVEVKFDDIDFVVDSEPDMVEMADGLADISVVTIGSMSAMGIADGSLLAEVDNNNLAKFAESGPCEACKGDGVVEMERFVVEDGYDGPSGGTVRSRVECPVCHGRKTLGGYRDEHGKWVKPLNHPKPDIAQVLSAQEMTAFFAGHGDDRIHVADVAHDGYLAHNHIGVTRHEGSSL